MQWLIDLVIEAIGIPPCFIDRGDPASWDWTASDFARDATWRDLDLSGIVPEGATSVLFGILIMDTSIGRDFYLRKKGNANSKNISFLTTQVASVWMKTDCVCPCDSNRFVQYNSNISAFGQIQVCVKGWWL